MTKNGRKYAVAAIDDVHVRTAERAEQARGPPEERVVVDDEILVVQAA